MSINGKRHANNIDNPEQAVELRDDYGRPIYNPSFEEIYDEDGDVALISCNNCTEMIRWKNGRYVCPNCGEEMSREEVFNRIGVEPLGPKCITCDNLYPGCVICQYGYLKD